MKNKVFLKVVIFSCEQPDKVMDTVGNLLNNEYDDIQVVLATSSIDSVQATGNYQPIHIPDKSVYHLRAHIGQLSQDSEWTLLFEDHNHVDSAYMGYVYQRLKTVPETVSSVYGPLSNKKSTNSWSFASFIMTGGKLWYPIQNAPDESVIFNVAYRSKLLAGKKYQLGEFEREAFKILRGEKVYNPDMIADHYQYRTFPSVMFYHFCNGRASGALCEKSLVRRISWSFRHAKAITGSRFLALKNIIHNHRQQENLPPYLEFQLYILCLSHALGAIYGAWFGVGKALKFLE
ncbi:hypothetical protein NP590_10540 [Methylomonas sp. SURF-2]|uniref:Glycosyltransferase 2-like domain-containing protein n=1 Tax=Methylomonas subterranea TaxID=2952225 RepID=A0ABT1TGG1_9GAMM|nr:hypothetical protein [Methylomonas sp. SURF-2]MCQ8104542.1 hypothetical protein [Methylomonas sp. SURF-2]